MRCAIGKISPETLFEINWTALTDFFFIVKLIPVACVLVVAVVVEHIDVPPPNPTPCPLMGTLVPLF